MKTCDVKLTVARSGIRGAQSAGDIVEVSLLEAGRLLRAGQIERPDAKVMKAIAEAEKAHAVERAAQEAQDAEDAAEAEGEG